MGSTTLKTKLLHRPLAGDTRRPKPELKMSEWVALAHKAPSTHTQAHIDP